ncbi:MAG: hypothetical protein HRT64_06770 [Erythrobacter sp.]|nr:hypothetical protein [Erythrobacter sp.]
MATRDEKAQLEELTKAIEDHTAAMAKLIEIEPALTKLAQKAPILEEMAESYQGARWFTKAIKWAAGMATALIVLWGASQAILGDKLQKIIGGGG